MRYRIVIDEAIGLSDAWKDKQEFVLPVYYTRAQANRALKDFRADAYYGPANPRLQVSHVFGVWHEIDGETT